MWRAASPFLLLMWKVLRCNGVYLFFFSASVSSLTDESIRRIERGGEGWGGGRKQRALATLDVNFQAVHSWLHRASCWGTSLIFNLFLRTPSAKTQHDDVAPACTCACAPRCRVPKQKPLKVELRNLLNMAYITDSTPASYSTLFNLRRKNFQAL